MRNLIATSLVFVIFTFTSTFAQSGKSRSAKSGNYVTKSYANSHKSTTYTSKSKK